MKDNLLILGSGGHGQVVREIAQAMGIFQEINHLDDNSTDSHTIGKLEDYKIFRREYGYAIAAFGINSYRMGWLKKLEELEYKLIPIIHPKAFLSPTAKVLEGTVIEAGALINTGVTIGKGCIIGLGSIVDHNAEIHEGCHIDSGVVVRANSIIKRESRISLWKSERTSYRGQIMAVSSIENYSFEDGV